LVLERHWIRDPLEQPDMAVLHGETGIQFNYEKHFYFSSFLCSSAEKSNHYEMLLYYTSSVFLLHYLTH